MLKILENKIKRKYFYSGPRESLYTHKKTAHSSEKGATTHGKRRHTHSHMRTTTPYRKGMLRILGKNGQ